VRSDKATISDDLGTKAAAQVQADKLLAAKEKNTGSTNAPRPSITTTAPMYGVPVYRRY
jgi:hypothetical protein